jgi:hypothetical protein
MSEAKYREAWTAALAMLDRDVDSGRATEAQRATFLRTLAAANAAVPNLRYPSFGIDEDHDGWLNVRWAYAGTPTFDFQVHRDGRLEWFAYSEDGGAQGTEYDLEDDIPIAAFDLLKPFTEAA